MTAEGAVSGHLSSADLRRAIAPLDRTRPVAVVAVSNNHAHMLDNWLCHMDALGLTQILIVALDGELAARVSTLPYACVRTAFDGSIADLWLQRARVWLMLAEAGVEFIACDSDAVWLRDPAPAFKDTPFDLLFSQATLHPRDVYRDWGFTLCCGLFGRGQVPASRRCSGADLA